MVDLIGKAAREMAKDLAREIGSRSREFYEFVLPPVDMRMTGESLVLLADMPGFEKKNIRVSLSGRMLWIRACKERNESGGSDSDSGGKGDGATQETGTEGADPHGEGEAQTIYSQRPSMIDKRIKLPIQPRGGRSGGEEGGEKRSPSASYEAGVLKVVIPIRKRGVEISVE